MAGASGEVASGPVARAEAGKISLSPKRVLEGSQARDPILLFIKYFEDPELNKTVH